MSNRPWSPRLLLMRAAGYIVTIAAALIMLYIALALLRRSGGGRTIIDVAPHVYTAHASNGADLRAAFLIRNISDKPVNVLGSISSCDCAAATSDFPISLAAGQSSTVDVRMHVAGLHEGGEVERRISLLLDREGAVPSLNIRVEAASGSATSQPVH